MKVEYKTWKEFKDNGLLWWINRILHTFGWAIVLVEDDQGIISATPAKVKYRGFSEVEEEIGFDNVTLFLKNNVDSLYKEAKFY